MSASAPGRAPLSSPHSVSLRPRMGSSQQSPQCQPPPQNWLLSAVPTVSASAPGLAPLSSPHSVSSLRPRTGSSQQSPQCQPPPQNWLLSADPAVPASAQDWLLSAVPTVPASAPGLAPLSSPHSASLRPRTGSSQQSLQCPPPPQDGLLSAEQWLRTGSSQQSPQCQPPPQNWLLSADPAVPASAPELAPLSCPRSASLRPRTGSSQQSPQCQPPPQNWPTTVQPTSVWNSMSSTWVQAQLQPESSLTTLQLLSMPENIATSAAGSTATSPRAEDVSPLSGILG